ncbi:metallopeptidase family protein [Desulfobacterota bacterium AH_259_B03_O07]|nr:metallopeptidase family protein [Desulfobacterota bacterium AH_259_B03_O07]
MNRKKFEELVENAFDAIPEEYRSKMENIVIKVEDYPTADDLEKLKIRRDSLLLGLYRGVPLPKRSVWQGAGLPDEIVIYQKDIEKICRNEGEIEDKVNEVLIHEIGHYFGLSDSEIYELMGGQS